MAASACSPPSISTKPKPFERPVSRSTMTTKQLSRSALRKLRQRTGAHRQWSATTRRTWRQPSATTPSPLTG
jgi:hypothetical protein